MTAEQLMSSPVTTLEADASLGAAWDLVETSRFRHVPIVAASSGALVGILSDRDLMRVVRSGDLTHRSVRELMATPVLSASNDTPIREVARILFEERIGAIPIVTEERHLRGILTRSDILRALVHEAPLDLWI